MLIHWKGLLRTKAGRAALAGAGMLAVFGMAGNSVAAEKTLRFADIFPENHYITQHLAKPFMESAARLSDEALGFRHYPAGQLVKSKEAIDANRNGLADITSVVPLYSSDQLPLSGVIGLPGFLGDVGSCTRAISKITTELLEAEYRKVGVHPLFVVCTSPYQLMTTKGPVETPEDTKGLKIRSPGGVQEVVVDAIGSVPVSMPATDIYTALQRGTIDGVSASLDTLSQYSLQDIGKSVTTNGQFGFVSIAYVINEKLWSGLGAEQQKLLSDAASEAVNGYLEWAKDSEDSLVADWKAKGVTLYEIPENVQSAWAPKFAATGSDWVKRMEARNLNAQEVLDAWSKYVAE